MVSAGWILMLALLAAGEDAPGEEDMRRQVLALGADYLEERDAARDALQKAGMEAEKVLLEGLAREDFRIRAGCLELLIEAGAGGGGEEILKIYRADPVPSVRETAYRWLLARGTTAVIVPLLEDEDDVFRRRELAEALIRSQEPVGLAALARAASGEPQKNVRYRMLRHLGRMLRGEKTPLDGAVVNYLFDSEFSDVRMEGLKIAGAGQTTDEVLERVSRLFLEAEEDVLLAGAYACLVEKNAGSGVFLEGLNADWGPVRRKCLERLKEMKCSDAMDRAADMLGEADDPEMRFVCLDYLLAFGERAVPALRELLDHPLASARIEAINGLVRLDDRLSSERVMLLFRNDGNAEVCRAAFRYLARTGTANDDLYLAGLVQADAEIREEAVRAAGDRGLKKAIPELLSLLESEDLTSGFLMRVMESLVSLGDEVPRLMAERVGRGEISEEIRERFLELREFRLVERALLASVSGGKCSGRFEGMFSQLAELDRERVARHLLRIVGEKENLPMVAPAHAGTASSLRSQLAVQALGVLKLKEGLPVIRRKLRDYPVLPYGAGVGCYPELVVAAHALGDPAPYEKFLKQVLSRSPKEGAPEAGELKWFTTLALIQKRVGDHAAALETYRRVLEWPLENPRLVCHYNVACIHALDGRGDEALRALGCAVDAGLRDVEWVEKDADLESLRDRPAFKAILRRMEKNGE